MWWVTFLDKLLLLCVLLVPWLAFIVCLVPFRRILKREWWVLLLLGSLIAVFFISNLNPKHEVLFQAISGAVHEPWLMAFRESVLTFGRAPLWMSQFGVGLPGMANPYFTAMSPLVSLLLFVPKSIPPFSILLLLHLLVAMGGGYLLARSVGVSIPGAVVAASAAVFNSWVFSRLQAEIYAAYALAYSWMPLFWALLLNWLRTNKLLHAAYAGVPLTFLALTMPTLAVFLSIGMNIMVVVRGIRLAWRRQWKQLRTLVIGLIVLGGVAALLGIPEFIGAREQAALAADTNRIAAPISNGPGTPNQGWRTHDFSAVDFGHLLLGRLASPFLSPSTNKLNGFGVPYAPHDEIVWLALLGFGAALVVRSWRRSTLAFGHLVLALVLANIFVSGFVYVAAWYWYPLFSRTGIFPGVGALLVVLIVTFAGVGVDALISIVAMGVRWVAHRISYLSQFIYNRFVVWTARAVVLLATAAWAAAQVVSPVAVGDRLQGEVDEDYPLFPDYRIATAPIQHRERFPHLALLREELPRRQERSRLFCMSDTSLWPSPCLEEGVLHSGFGLVGIGEQSWTPPGYMARTIAEAMRPWDLEGAFSPVLHSVLRLAGVEGIVATRELPLPLVGKLAWNTTPKTEAYGYISGFLQKERGVEWRPGYLIELFVHTLPNPNARVEFVQSILVKDEPGADAAALDALGKQNFDVGRVAVIHSTQGDSITSSELGERSSVAVGPTDSVELTFSSPAPGEWNVQGRIPSPGTLLFSQLFYPGFRAWVNGKAVPVERADLFLTAVDVPGGEVDVRLIYAPVAMMFSSLLSVGTAGVMLFATVRHRRMPAKWPQ